MILAHSPIARLGVEESLAAVRFGEESKPEGTWAGRRLLWLRERPAFELSFWCGTCPVLFERLEGANETLSIAGLEERLGEGLHGIDHDVLETFGALLPSGQYLPMLLEMTPRLVVPAAPDDYFSHEQVDTWGLNGFWGLPEHPRTPYYRTFETAVEADVHLYEFVVPMVPPTWNDRSRVRQHGEALAAGAVPTAVSVSTLDIGQPATPTQGRDCYQHWTFTHFLLDGHHKLEAAATAGRPLRLLALVAVDACLAPGVDVRRLIDIRARPVRRRPLRVF